VKFAFIYILLKDFYVVIDVRFKVIII